jgi:1-acyl-sn-glycerol-3-phosphate acyltransferase
MVKLNKERVNLDNGSMFMRKDRGSKLRFVRPLLGPLQVTGNIENLPEGGVLVIVNHSSLIDPFIVYLVLRKVFGRKVAFMATAGLWKYPILGFLLKWRKFIPVYRKSANPESALAYAEKALRAGRVVAMYPEGGIPIKMGSEDQLPSKFKTGAARLWARTMVPVLPIAQLGARRVMSGGKWKQIAGVLTAWWRRYLHSPKHKPSLHVHIGKLINQKATGNVDEDSLFLRDAVVHAFEEAKRLAS